MLERLRDLEAATTPGPWSLSANGYVYTGQWFGLIAKVVNDQHQEAALIVEARNALPDLLAAAEALVRVLEWPLPQGTVESYSLPPWLAREARAALAALTKKDGGDGRA